MSNSLTYCDLPAEISMAGSFAQRRRSDAAGLPGRQYRVAVIRQEAGQGAHYAIPTQARRGDGDRHRPGVDDYQVVRLAGTLTPRAKLLAAESGLDVAPLGKIPHLRTPGLLVMDMDSTAIEIECIDEIAKLAGVGEQVAEVTERAMRGELDFTASLRQRVGTLKGPTPTSSSRCATSCR